MGTILGTVRVGYWDALAKIASFCNYDIIMIRFEWDEGKNQSNKKKHKVSFEEARSVFFDEFAIEFPDPDHSEQEARFLMLGRSYLLRVLVVCHCLRESDTVIRIISARKATSKERTFYSKRGQP